MSARFATLLLAFLVAMPLLVFLVITTLLVFLVGCSASATPLSHGDDIVSGGGYGESDGVWISSPNVRFRQDGPGVAFGQIKPPVSETKEYSYVVLVKGFDVNGKKGSSDFRSGCDDRSASNSIKVEVDGVALEFGYKMELNTQTRRVATETLTINGKTLDPRKGRVLLVSYTGKDFTWQQVATELPKDPQTPRTTAEMEVMAKDLMKQLQKENLAVRTFLSPAASAR